MSLSGLLKEFAHDTKTQVLLLLILGDFLLGVAAALKVGTFRWAYVSDFLKSDVLGKVFPYMVLYWMALLAGHTDVVIPGLDLGLIAGAVYVALVAAFVGSILASLKHLGLALPAQFGGEVPPPGP